MEGDCQSTEGTIETAATTSASMDYEIQCNKGSARLDVSQSLFLRHDPRPILVGYAFGPKKMSTMGIIMAEASKAVSTVMTAAVPVAGCVGENDDIKWEESRKQERLDLNTENGGENYKRQKLGRTESADMVYDAVDYDTKNLTASESSSKSKLLSKSQLTTAALEERGRKYEATKSEKHKAGAESEEASLSLASLSTRHSISVPIQPSSGRGPDREKSAVDSRSLDLCGLEGIGSGIQFSIAGGPNGVSGIHNIVRFFRSSCSSAASIADSSTTMTATTALMPPSSSASSATVPMKTHSYVKQSQHQGSHILQPIRVSFVPLDLDAPLEEQHGGEFDAILHKLTEDILCLSKLASSVARPSLEELFLATSDPLGCGPTSQMPLDDNQANAISRVKRLAKYKQDHPQCCLVDHPSNIQTLMSRSDIANKLSECLVGVTTRSGVPVRSPCFEVVGNSAFELDTERGGACPGNTMAEKIAKKIHEAPFTYPLIAKPLTAAGTKESHRMVVLLNRSGLERIQTPCLLQEYSNHDGTLFKVYVLGDTVRVFPRPSLPNLPCGEYLNMATAQHSFVEFDSQRPYPKLSDFGVFQDVDAAAVKSGDSRCHASKRKRDFEKLVTADEIRPVVSVLRRAFGLELFGFDVLVANRMTSYDNLVHEREMLVVDVNYFPSYKEVSNFPMLLAQYLTQRAIEGRVRSSNPR